MIGRAPISGSIIGTSVLIPAVLISAAFPVSVKLLTTAWPAMVPDIGMRLIGNIISPATLTGLMIAEGVFSGSSVNYCIISADLYDRNAIQPAGGSVTDTDIPRAVSKPRVSGTIIPTDVTGSIN